jgi:hypothetical protein
LLLLLFVGRYALEPGNRHNHREQQVKLRVLRHERLHEEGALFGIQPGGDPVGDVVEHAFRDTSGVGVVARERVPVSHEIETIVAILKCSPVLERAHQMTQVELPGRAHARNDSWLHSVNNLSSSR